MSIQIHSQVMGFSIIVLVAQIRRAMSPLYPNKLDQSVTGWWNFIFHRLISESPWVNTVSTEEMIAIAFTSH